MCLMHTAMNCVLGCTSIPKGTVNSLRGLLPEPEACSRHHPHNTGFCPNSTSPSLNATQTLPIPMSQSCSEPLESNNIQVCTILAPSPLRRRRQPCSEAPLKSPSRPHRQPPLLRRRPSSSSRSRSLMSRRSGPPDPAITHTLTSASTLIELFSQARIIFRLRSSYEVTLMSSLPIVGCFRSGIAFTCNVL